MKNILLEDRNCECCGNKSNKLELIWSGSRIVKGISDTYLFEHSISVCSRCGFAFSSPCPTEESLKVFYGDSLSNFGVLPSIFLKIFPCHMKVRLLKLVAIMLKNFTAR